MKCYIQIFHYAYLNQYDAEKKRKFQLELIISVLDNITTTDSELDIFYKLLLLWLANKYFIIKNLKCIKLISKHL